MQATAHSNASAPEGRRLWSLKAGPADQGNPRLWRVCRLGLGVWQIALAYAASGGGACGETLTFLNGGGGARRLQQARPRVHVV